MYNHIGNEHACTQTEGTRERARLRLQENNVHTSEKRGKNTKKLTSIVSQNDRSRRAIYHETHAPGCINSEFSFFSLELKIFTDN